MYLGALGHCLNGLRVELPLPLTLLRKIKGIYLKDYKMEDSFYYELNIQNNYKDIVDDELALH